MKPSETAQAISWLAQFEVDDRPSAAALLDMIRFVPGGEVVGGIRRALEEMLLSRSLVGPTALVPLMSVEDMIPISSGTLPSHPTVFSDYDPSQRHAGEPGSEALVAQLVREVRASSDPKDLLPFPLTLAALRDKKARTVLFITDYIGSGRQVLDYVASWQRHPSIRSWRSGHRISFRVLAFAATAQGLDAVRKGPHVDGVSVVEVVPSLAEVVAQADGDELVKLCRNYARRGKLGGNPLGHGGVGGMYASSFSVPNNLPAILIRPSRAWIPYFAGRSVPSALSDEIGAHRPPVDFAAELRVKQELRLARQVVDETSLGRWAWLVMVLALELSTAEEIALRLSIDVAEARRILRAIEALELRDQTGRMTKAGQGVLAMARRKRRRVTAGLKPSASPYYPRLKR